MIALCVTCVVYLAALGYTGSVMPERVASHFGFAGEPDGWMSRPAYLTSMAAVGVALPVVLALAAWAVRMAPVGVINLPHRDYWLAPERRERTRAEIAGRMLWLSSLVVVFLLGVHVMVDAANRQEPRRLSAFIWIWAAGFLLVTVVWLLLLVRRFGRVPADED
jgi:hypothetical protein